MARLTPHELEELKRRFGCGYIDFEEHKNIFNQLLETIEELERVCQLAGNAAVKAQQATKDIEHEFEEYRKLHGPKELHCSRCEVLLGQNYHQGAPGFEYLCMPCVKEVFPSGG